MPILFIKGYYIHKINHNLGFDSKLMERLDDVRVQHIVADNSTKQIIKVKSVLFSYCHENLIILLIMIYHNCLIIR